MVHRMQWLPVGLALALLGVAPLTAQEGMQEEEGTEEQAATPPEADPDEEAAPEAEVTEVIVVTASRKEQVLHDVPTAVTVLTAEDIAEIPADDYGDLLRNVPGLNVVQFSARDIQVTGRSATNSLATTELVLLDGRTIYLDFFGFVMWDFLPVNPTEIKQIEVVRGPGSAVWGANAMTGVINLITKAPRDMVGTSILVGAGDLGTAYGSITHAGVRDRLGYKLSGSYYEQDPYPRPTGLIPGTTTPYPPFENQGTEQPKADLRFDYDVSDQAAWTFSAGYAGTDGIIHTGIGPFDIDSGSNLGYGKVDYTRQAMRVGLFVNLLDGEASNLLTVGPTGAPILLGFESETYNLDFSDTRLAGEHHILTYGANARSNSFDLTIAPEGDSRDEYGVFLQDEILLGEKVRWLVGGRWDDVDPIGSVVSPRTALLYSPVPNHTLRASYNRAFRAPSLINNFLNIVIVNRAVIPPIPGLTPAPIVLTFPSAAVGNPQLEEERLDALEVGYVGTWGNRVILTASAYRNETKDSADFFARDFYNAANPVPGWPLPPFLLDVPPFAGAFPAAFSYRNVGELVDKGVELSLNLRPSEEWSWFFNYSYQDDPEVEGIPPDEINLPPTHRANVGGSYDSGRFFVNANANYADEAFWTDVLDSRFHGPTDDYTQVSLTTGVRFSGDRVVFSVTGTNLFDEDVQQHVFGDIIERKVAGQLELRF